MNLNSLLPYELCSDDHPNPSEANDVHLGHYSISPDPDYDIPVDDEPLHFDFGIDGDVGDIPGFNNMPDLVDSDDEEDSDDEFRDNEREISELDLP